MMVATNKVSTQLATRMYEAEAAYTDRLAFYRHAKAQGVPVNVESLQALARDFLTAVRDVEKAAAAAHCPSHTQVIRKAAIAAIETVKNFKNN